MANHSYGYCHVAAKHPDALYKISYILTYGKVIASSGSSITIRGVYADNLPYIIYIVTTNLNDGQQRGIVSAYLDNGSGD